MALTPEEYQELRENLLAHFKHLNGKQHSPTASIAFPLASASAELAKAIVLLEEYAEKKGLDQEAPPSPG